jgi:hypothetical protein
LESTRLDFLGSCRLFSSKDNLGLLADGTQSLPRSSRGPTFLGRIISDPLRDVDGAMPPDADRRDLAEAMGRMRFPRESLCLRAGCGDWPSG